MIVTVTPNPALDLTYTVPALEVGESQHVEQARLRAGGKGLNVARVIHQLKYPVTAVAALSVGPGSKVGVGSEFEKELLTSGIPHRIVSGHGATRRSVAIVDTSTGATTVLNERGSAFEPTTWQKIIAELDRLAPSARCISGSGSLPPGAPETLYADVVQWAAAHGMPAVIDATGPALLHAASAGATVLKPNRRELAETTGESDPVVGARHLLALGAGLVLVSLGEDGMIAVGSLDGHGDADETAGISSADSNTVYHARLPRPLAGNPTGAGDAAVAGAALCLAEGDMDVQTILARATAFSAAAVLMPAAGEISPDHPHLEQQLIIGPFTLKESSC